MARKKKSKYPPYPSSSMDYAIRHSAGTELRKLNKVICIYCRHQSKTEQELTHEPDCPARNEKPEV